VADEYGGTAGIVTLEDLVEELVGDIRDEYDVATDVARRTRTGDVEVDGLLNLDDFEDETGLQLPDGPYETVAGYIVAQLGHVPDVGEAATYAGNRLLVTEVDGRRIARVRVSAETPDSTADTARSLAEDAVSSPLLSEDMSSERPAEVNERPADDGHVPTPPTRERPHGSTRIG